ncbi:unnamed protein product [Moneuplotes crassus]|uniref:Uncharacterized protein n=1 Tax=Euplotes crassus TaxID=5936 RepID=A0AAD1X6A5_EUPCR|nr:unnamed protein product [Moneuplotes crassus]
MGGNCSCKKAVAVKEKYETKTNPEIVEKVGSPEHPIPEPIRHSVLVNESDRRPSNMQPSSIYQSEGHFPQSSIMNSMSSNQHKLDVENNFPELQRRMKKIKKIKDRVKKHTQRSRRKPNSMLINDTFKANKYLELPVVNKGHPRRNTDKIGIFNEESKGILSALEPINEKEAIDYNIGQ